MALIYIHNKQCSRENMFPNKNWHNQVHIKKTCWTFMEVQWDTVYSRIRFRNVLSYKRKPADIKQSFTVTSGTVDDSFLNLLFSMPSGYVENFKSNFSLGPYFLLFTFFYIFNTCKMYYQFFNALLYNNMLAFAVSRPITKFRTFIPKALVLQK